MFADVTSANVVGYAQAPKLIAESEEVGGTLFMVPQFKSIAKTTYNIQDIKLDPETATDWVDCLTTISLEGDGDTIQSYSYVKDYDGMGDGNTITGWLDPDTGCTLADIEIKPGECVIIQTMMPCAVTTSGEVVQGAENSFVMAEGGSYFIGNPCPVAKNIQSFVIDPNTATEWVDCLTTISLAGDGDTIQSYSYVKDYDGMGDGNTITGWLDPDTGCTLADIEIKPGEGLIAIVTLPTSIKLPSAL